MNRITTLFEQKKTDILSIYFTAGFPNVDDSATIIMELAAAGVEMIEIGIPFSDPMADGPVIQRSDDIALKNGMNLHKLFDQLQDIRKTVSIPLIMMGYINPVLQFGFESFCKRCKEIGIDGLIIPDLPFREYELEFKAIIQKYNLENIFLISPQTSTERITVLDTASNSFIYMVSSSSITGAKNCFAPEQIDYFKRVKSMQLKNPLLVGFGISNHETYKTVCEYANGAIIGSGFIKALENSNDLKTNIHQFVKNIRG